MELEYDITKLATSPEHSSDGVFPIFHHEVRRDEDATSKAGKPVYKNVPYVEIVCPGNDKERPNMAVTSNHKQRWPKEWAAFEEGRDAPKLDGMPIEEWTHADKHLAMTLRASEVHTVEQLSKVDDINLQNLGPGMMNLKNMAIKWLKDRDEGDVELEAANEKIVRFEEKVTSLEDRAKNAEEELEAAKERILELKRSVADPAVTVLVKNGGWWNYDGEKYREADLPEAARKAIEELEK